MTRTYARSQAAARARALVEGLQGRFADLLEGVARGAGDDCTFEPIEWLRDDGTHGGGMRRATGDTPLFDRASINVSQVHYDDLPDKRLGSATALSTIIHPRNPHAASIHMHISWTEMRDGSGYWRVMADLNPSIPYADETEAFGRMLAGAAGPYYEEGAAQGDRYFYIPALERHRGVSHFYLEGHATDDAEADEALALRVGNTVIEHYCKGLARSIAAHPEPSAEDRQRQLEYHTLYLFQVLTLDRGTTSGLLVHAQNDVGIMGSLPSHVDRECLKSWRGTVPEPQEELLDALVSSLPETVPCPVTIEAKRALASAVREHYRKHPEALKLQASGNVVPPTVANHR